MGTSVTHGDHDVIFLKMDHGFVDLFTFNVLFLFRIIVDFVITNKYHSGIIILYDFHTLIIYDVENGECRISNFPDLTDRKSCRDRRDAIL